MPTATRSRKAPISKATKAPKATQKPKGPYDAFAARVLAKISGNPEALNVSSVAKTAKVSRVKLSYWLNGHRPMSSDEVVRLGHAVGIRFEDAPE